MCKGSSEKEHHLLLWRKRKRRIILSDINSNNTHLFSKREDILYSAPVPFFVNFVGGLDAESGRPQPSKPKVCELVDLVLGDGGGYYLHIHPADSLFFVFSCVFRAFRVMDGNTQKNPIHETKVQPKNGFFNLKILYPTDWNANCTDSKDLLSYTNHYF